MLLLSFLKLLKPLNIYIPLK